MVEPLAVGGVELSVEVPVKVGVSVQGEGESMGALKEEGGRRKEEGESMGALKEMRRLLALQGGGRQSPL